MSAEDLQLGREQLVAGSGADLPTHLANREHFYRCVLESLSEGVLITDGEGRILFANSRAEKITGFSRAEMLGSISHELFTPSENWPAARRRLADRLSGKEEAYEHEHIHKDGSHHWVAVRAVPYRDAEGKIVGSIGTLRCIERQKGLELENEYLREEERLNLASIVGDSPALMRVLEQIMVVAATQANVLVLGESGTGKELVARAIHEASPRAGKPLVRVNCASVPKELFESEFFGHVKGAFTGAVRDRIGRFELADGGTLFLDEVGEIPQELQAKLLRVLQDGQFERVGEERTRSVNVRIVAATNRDLPSEAKAGRFRQDLYYRLGVFPIQLPPLRDRRSDIPALAEHFVRLSATKFAVQRPKLSRSNLEELQRYDWPGNVRELQNVIERAVILARGGPMHFDLAGNGPSAAASVVSASIPAAVAPAAPALDSPDLTLADLDRLEREIIQRAIADSGGKVYGPEGAAAKLGLKPTTLASKLKALGLKEA
jgi:formate hydrogenlyase transcriptional activator